MADQETVNPDLAPPKPKVVDLMEELERSVAAARAAREAKREVGSTTENRPATG